MEIKISNIILDYNLYPRNQINSLHVKDLCDAIEAGCKLPPIIVDSKTKKVIDGFHRVIAHQRMKLDKIDATIKNYKSEQDMFIDAVFYNSAHGQKFSHYEIVKIFEKGQELGIEPERLASASHLTIKRINELMELKTAVGDKGKIVPIKRTLVAWKGKKITKKQIEGNTVAGGFYPLYYINQVINILENDLIDYQDDKIIQRIIDLKNLIESKLNENKAEYKKAQ
jgi:hypothetical protein